MSAMELPTDGSPPLGLLDLPSEIHLLLVAQLPLPAILRLRISNRHFYNFIPPLTHAELLSVEKQILACRPNHSWSHIYPDNFPVQYYACKDCLRLRPLPKFSHDQTGTSVDKNQRGAGGRKAYRRFCVECGLKHDRFVPGRDIELGKGYFVICGDCRLFKKTAGWVSGRRRCLECWEVLWQRLLKRELRKQLRRESLERALFPNRVTIGQAHRELRADRMHVSYHSAVELSWLLKWTDESIEEEDTRNSCQAIIDKCKECRNNLSKPLPAEDSSGYRNNWFTDASSMTVD